MSEQPGARCGASIDPGSPYHLWVADDTTCQCGASTQRGDAETTRAAEVDHGATDTERAAGEEPNLTKVMEAIDGACAPDATVSLWWWGIQGQRWMPLLVARVRELEGAPGYQARAAEGAERERALHDALSAAVAMFELMANRLDTWMPDDPHPEIQEDLRRIAANLRSRFALASVAQLSQDPS